jgi:tetratricopeptide (TPR) repeat protein
MRHLNRVLLTLCAIALTACGTAQDRAGKYLARAKASFEAQDYVKAELDIKNSLQIDPNSAEAHYLFAQIAEKEQNWAAMYGQLQAVVQLDPSHTEARLKLGSVYLISGNADQASEQAEAVLAQDPQNPGGHVLRAGVLDRKGDDAAAIAEVQTVLQADPGNVAAVSLLAKIYSETDVDKALATLDEGITHSKDSATLRLMKVGLLERDGRYDDVESGLKELIQLYPDQKMVRYRLANFYTQRDRLDDAEALLRDTAKVFPDDVTAKLRLAEFLANHRDAQAAEQTLQDFVKAEPKVYQFRFALARLYESTQRGNQAEELYRALITEQGTSALGLDARNKLAALYLQQRSRDKARALVDEVLATDASNADALLLRASLALSDNKIDDAIGDLRMILRNDPSSEKALTLLGQAHVMAGSTNLAEETFRKLVAAHPDNLDGRLALARLMVQQENWPDAETQLNSIARQRPQDTAITRMLIDVLIRRGEWSAAHAQAQRIGDLPDNEALGHYLQARVYQAQQQFDAAIKEYRAAIDAQPRALEALSGLVGSYLSLNQGTQALDYLNDYVKRVPDSFHAQTLIGQVQARLKQWDPAKAAFEQAISINNSWVPAYRDLVTVYLATDDTDGAIKVIERGLQAVPDNSDLKLMQATVYERLERYKDAIAVYDSILQKDNSVTVAANNLAALIADHDREPDRLQHALEVAHRFETSDNPLFLDTVGWVYYRLGNFQQAVGLLERAAQGASQVAQVRYHLGMAYYATEQRDLAKRELQAAVDGKDKDFVGREEAQATLAQL